jgi:hypothetical protein
MKEIRVLLARHHMHKLPAVEEAKALFAEAREWGMWNWMAEKRRARRTADAAWEALDACEQKVKARWSADVRTAAESDKALRAARHKADRAHNAAEDHFDEADRRMSTSMACEGAQMAIEAWVLREEYIRKLEEFGRGRAKHAVS